MRVLLTGATGFVGQYVARKLTAEGVDIVTVGLRPVATKNLHIQADLLDMNDYSTLVKVANATHLIHLAWYAKHGEYWSSPLNMDWIKATAMLVEAFCRGGGEHITVSGTCAEYDWAYGYCTEDVTPINPKTIYGIAKDASRRICQDICAKYDVPLAWGRIFFPYGKGEPETRLLPAVAGVFRDKKAAFGVNANCYRDFLHVTDVANALVTLSSSKATGCINISSGEAVRIHDVVSLMAEIISADPSEVLRMGSTRSGEPKFLVGNNDILHGFGWQKNINLIDGLKDFL